MCSRMLRGLRIGAMAKHKVRAAGCGDRHEADGDQRAQENGQDRNDRDRIPQRSVPEFEADEHLSRKYANRTRRENPQYPRPGIGSCGSSASAGCRYEIARPVDPGRAVQIAPSALD